MSKTMRVTLEIDVDELSPALRKEMAKDMMQEPPEELPTMADSSVTEIASVLENLTEHTGAELFAGSDIYAQFLECRVIDAAWK